MWKHQDLILSFSNSALRYLKNLDLRCIEDLNSHFLCFLFHFAWCWQNRVCISWLLGNASVAVLTVSMWSYCVDVSGIDCYESVFDLVQSDSLPSIWCRKALFRIWIHVTLRAEPVYIFTVSGYLYSAYTYQHYRSTANKRMKEYVATLESVE